MCEKTNMLTKEEFGTGRDTYCVYYLDDDGVIHFITDSYDKTEGVFTTDFNNVGVFSKKGAQIALLICAALFDYDLHIVHISTKVIWDC